MKLLRRFTFYLGGFGIGIIFVLFFWGGKKSSCSYFPNSRVLKEMRTKTTQFTPEALQFFQTNQIDTVVIRKFFNQGDIEFEKSQTDREQPCRVYVINGSHQKDRIQIEVEECKKADSIATITKAKFLKFEE